MAGPLVLGILFVTGTLFGDQQIHRFQRLAALDVASRLEGQDKAVKVEVGLNGLAGIWGDLEFAEITASDFVIQGLPLFTEPDRSKSGRIGTLGLRLSDFTLRKLHVHRLDADIPDCRYDFGLARDKHRLRLSRSGTGTGSVTIKEADLARFIMAKFPEITDCTVRADKGVVWVEGHGRFLLVTTDFTCIAKLGVVDGTKIVLQDAKVYFDWNRVDGPARDAVLKLLTPVVDLDRDLGLFDAVTVDKVDCRDGKLVASGRTKIPQRPTPPVSIPRS
ncbi:MAG: LmeA family phospholipid-binding protein [Fimbriimonadaceae bacterium]|nr:LmeA family phospholipid-binding protein [Fimbriimonadaceae bacterium]